MERMTFIDFFSGIGGFHSGFEKAGMECIGWCEFDKFAQASYRAMYDTDNLWFGDDVTKVKGKDLPKADLWTFGFPCQDISIAGNQKGIKKGTRSGLFYEIMRLLDECKENKPKWFVCENVKNLLSIDNGTGFLNVICEMAERGYSVEWGVYNSKDYGVPQSRERVYIAGYNGGTSGRKLLPRVKKSGSTIKQVGNLIDTLSFGGNPQRGRVYSPDGVSPTVNCMGGGGLEPKVLTNANLGVLVNVGPIRIRKLTPKECWRLQGFTDAQYEKAAAVNSKSQLYKQAGNAVTVNVVEEIGRHIIGVANMHKKGGFNDGC